MNLKGLCKLHVFGVFCFAAPALCADAAQLSPHSLAAALPRIDLQPVLTNGLVQPVLVTNAHDGSDRLFIVEQPGRIKVLKPGEKAPIVFLDLTSKVLFGGEQGLLGLTFHPQYSANKRFFVDYTRKSDGATIIVEYHASDASPDNADIKETVLLGIPQPYSNHNGGMVEFGPDGFLYIGMGDGGSGNDPENRAQNAQELLGKILRIDVDRPEAGKPYAIPPSNPYFNSSAGRPEIFALGLRNPWRFSFDRATGRLYAGDVGQSLVEEVDIVRLGGNYGWRVHEGSRCTGLGPAPCSTTGFVPPIVEYSHDQGRCSVTGGYVYRGSRGTLPQGTYLYGDYCSGELFAFADGEQAILAKTSLNISSFGEDESGEIYVVGLGGTVHRITSPDAPAQPAVYFPSVATAAGRTPDQDEFTGFAVANLDISRAALSFKAFDSNGSLIQGRDIVNPKAIELQSGEQLALVDVEIFGSGFHSGDRQAWVRLDSNTDRLASFFLSFDARLSTLDGSDAGPRTFNRFLLPDLEPGGFTQVHLVNPNAGAATVNIEVLDAKGTTRRQTTRLINANGVLAETSESLFPGIALDPADHIRGSATAGLVPFEILGVRGQYARGLNGQDATAGSTVLYCPQYVVGAGYRSVLSVINVEAEPGTATFHFYRDDGSLVGSRNVPVAGNGKILVTDPAFFGNLGPGLSQGFVEVRSSGPLFAGSVAFGDSGGRIFSAALPLISILRSRLVYSQVASNATYFTGVSIVNPGPNQASALIEVYDKTGQPLASGRYMVPAYGRVSKLLTEYFPSLAGRNISTGYIRVSSEGRLASFAVFGTNDLTALAAIPSQLR